MESSTQSGASEKSSHFWLTIRRLRTFYFERVVFCLQIHIVFTIHEKQIPPPHSCHLRVQWSCRRHRTGCRPKLEHRRPERHLEHLRSQLGRGDRLDQRQHRDLLRHRRGDQRGNHHHGALAVVHGLHTPVRPAVRLHPGDHAGQVRGPRRHLGDARGRSGAPRRGPPTNPGRPPQARRSPWADRFPEHPHSPTVAPAPT